MPYARNALDGIQVYFEDDGGNGEAVVTERPSQEKLLPTIRRVPDELCRPRHKEEAESTEHDHKEESHDH